MKKIENFVVFVVRGRAPSVTSGGRESRDLSECVGVDVVVNPHPYCEPRDHTGKFSNRGKQVGVEFSSCR